MLSKFQKQKHTDEFADVESLPELCDLVTLKIEQEDYTIKGFNNLFLWFQYVVPTYFGKFLWKNTYTRNELDDIHPDLYKYLLHYRFTHKEKDVVYLNFPYLGVCPEEEKERKLQLANALYNAFTNKNNFFGRANND